VFVNAITDDSAAQQLASKFSFQYIPTSFFIAADGKVADSFTGVTSESDMRARLDRLAGQ
jgi:thioredoxin-like negative regulator of GroEL